MPQNIEIKARISDLAALEAKVRRFATAGPTDLTQDDTFFTCPQGRLKLREVSPDAGELIFYTRPNTAGPKTSDYWITPTSTPAPLREVLERSLGVIGRIRKRRRLYFAGHTRIHLDQVEALGSFLELEVVLQPGQTEAAGHAIARGLIDKLAVTPSQLIETAYLDLLPRP